MRNLQVKFRNLRNQQPISISLSGNLTTKSAIDFKNDLLQVMNDNDQDCHLDLTSLEALDVTGVNALAMAHKVAQRSGRKFVIVSKDYNPAEEFLHLTKFSNYFNFQRA